MFYHEFKPLDIGKGVKRAREETKEFMARIFINDIGKIFFINSVRTMCILCVSNPISMYFFRSIHSRQ